MARLLKGRRVVGPFRKHRKHSAFAGLALLVAAPLSIGSLLQLNRAIAAEVKGDSDTAAAAVPLPGSERSLVREPSAGGSLVIRGTRPELISAEGPAPAGAGRPNFVGGGYGPAGYSPWGYGPPGNLGFRPLPLSGYGWNYEYDYGGLNPPNTPR